MEKGDTGRAAPGELILTLGNKCPLACTYCHNRPALRRGKTGPLHIDLAVRVAREFAQMAEAEGHRHVAIQLTGGEPLAYGQQYIEALLDGIRSATHDIRLEVRLRIQTNSIMLSQQWIDLFLSREVCISTSIDGPPFIQDLTRPAVDGSAGSVRIQQALELLKRNNIGFGCLAVVTSHSIPYADQITRYLCDSGCSQTGFLPCLDYGPVISPSEYGEFLCRAFDTWAAITDPPPVREFSRVLRGIVHGRISTRDVCTFGRACPVCPVVDPEGLMYVCELWMGNPDGLLGDLGKMSFEQVMTSEATRTIRARVNELPQKCQHCSYAWLCRGGCIYQQVGPDHSDAFCEAYLALFRHIEAATQTAVGQLKQLT